MAINSGVPLTGLPGMKDSLTRIVNQQATIENNASCFYSDVENAIELGASLALFSNAYKEDVVFPLLPTDGSGDLTFTRASTGTRINSAGLVEVCPWNLVEQSETFGLSPWSAINLGITTNATTAPNGTTTAEKLMVTTANTPHQVQQGFNNENANHTVFIYAKKSELNFIQLALGNSVEQYANFNLNTGVVGTKGTYCASSSIESVGDGWYKCIAYFNQGTIPSLMVYVTNSASSDWGGTVSYSGANNTDGLFVWGYQVNIGSTAKPYFPTTDRLNIPRIDYTGGGCGKLLLEPQSTNLVTYSEDYTNAAWSTSDVTVTANTTISPSGYQDADTINSIAEGQRINQTITVSANTQYTFSFYAKKGTMVTPRYSVYDVSNGALILAQVDYSSLVNTSTWSRITATFTTPSGCTSIFVYPINGASTGTIFLWGAQLEAGSYVSSYVPTLASSVTRLADAASKTGISSLIGQTEGTLFAEIDYTLNTESAGILGIDAGALTFAYLFIGASNSINFNIYNASSPQALLLYTLPSSGKYKIAGAYKANDFVLYVNGVERASDTSGTVPACSILSIDSTAYGLPANSKHSQAIVFPTRLTNTQLAELTTI